MAQEIILPDGSRVDESALAPPSVDAQFLAQGIQQMINMLQGIQMQLDTMIRIESNETSRAEIKSRIRRADEIAKEQQARAEAEAAERVAEMQRKDTEAQRIIAERNEELQRAAAATGVVGDGTDGD